MNWRGACTLAGAVRRLQQDAGGFREHDPRSGVPEKESIGRQDLVLEFVKEAYRTVAIEILVSGYMLVVHWLITIRM